VAGSPWLVIADRAPAPALRLICLPYLGGSGAVFRSWAGALGRDVEVLPVELPGHGTRFGEPPLRSLTALASAVADALEAELRGRYALFGYSMGGLLAFEVARLVAANRLPPPAHLFVAATRAPDVPRREDAVSGAPEAEVFAALRRYEGLPFGLDGEPELAAALLPAIRADFAALEGYRFRQGPPLEVPVTAIRGADDATVTPADVEAWRAHTDAPLRAATVPGAHFFLHTDRDALLRELRADLAAAVGG
jgi:surfactin synthase thioesterase subunit